MQEYGWPFAGISQPPFEDHTVPYPGCPAQPDYPLHADLSCLPTPVAPGLQPQDVSSSIPGAIAPECCHAALHHRALLPPDLRWNSTGIDGVFHPAGNLAQPGHMHMELGPGVPAYSPMHTDVAFHGHHVGSPEQNWLENIHLAVPAHIVVCM